MDYHKRYTLRYSCLVDMAGWPPKHPLIPFFLLIETPFSAGHLFCNKDFFSLPCRQMWPHEDVQHNVIWTKGSVGILHLLPEEKLIFWDFCNFALSPTSSLLTWNPCMIAGTSVVTLNHEVTLRMKANNMDSGAQCQSLCHWRYRVILYCFCTSSLWISLMWDKNRLSCLN